MPLDAEPKQDEKMMPYQLPFPPDAATEIVVPSVLPKDEREWVPQAESVWFRPLCLSISQGYWVNLLKVQPLLPKKILEPVPTRPMPNRSWNLSSEASSNPVGSDSGRFRPSFAI